MENDIRHKWIKLISIMLEKFQPKKLIVPLTISTPIREALCHFNSIYDQSILYPNINMALCLDQMFFYGLAIILFCYIHTCSTKLLQTYLYKRGCSFLFACALMMFCIVSFKFCNEVFRTNSTHFIYLCIADCNR